MHKRRFKQKTVFFFLIYTSGHAQIIFYHRNAPIMKNVDTRGVTIIILMSKWVRKTWSHCMWRNPLRWSYHTTKVLYKAYINILHIKYPYNIIHLWEYSLTIFHVSLYVLSVCRKRRITIVFVSRLQLVNNKMYKIK